MNMDLDLVRGLIVIFLIISFVGMVVWLWLFADRRKLDQAAYMPLQDRHPINSEEAGHE